MSAQRPDYARRRLIAAAVLAGAVAFILVIVVLATRGGAPQPVPAPIPTTTTTMPAPPTPGPTPDVQTPPAVPVETCGGDPGTIAVLVNKHHPLCPADFVPELRVVDVPAAGGEQYLRPDAAERLEAMYWASVDEAGLGFLLASGYRSYDTQVSTYGYWVEQDGQAIADTYSARPGYSEHQTGLAMDVVDLDNTCNGEACFGDTAEGQWIAANAWRFGFIVRYPQGREGTTGYRWEPWHLRYVGESAAAQMRDLGIETYEDLLGTGDAPDYLP